MSSILFLSTYAQCPGAPSGSATFYDSQDGYGHCGSKIPNDGLYAAISTGCYSASICGKQVKVTHGGKSIVVPILDSCQSCDAGHIDISRSAFQNIASLDLGVIPVSWEYVDGSAPAKKDKSEADASPASKPIDVAPTSSKGHKATKTHSDTEDKSSSKPSEKLYKSPVDNTATTTQEPHQADVPHTGAIVKPTAKPGAYSSASTVAANIVTAIVFFQ